MPPDRANDRIDFKGLDGERPGRRSEIGAGARPVFPMTLDFIQIHLAAPITPIRDPTSQAQDLPCGLPPRVCG